MKKARKWTVSLIRPFPGIVFYICNEIIVVFMLKTKVVPNAIIFLHALQHFYRIQ